MTKKNNISLHDNFVCLFAFGYTICRILVPQPGVEPLPPAVEAWIPNHWSPGNPLHDNLKNNIVLPKALNILVRYNLLICIILRIIISIIIINFVKHLPCTSHCSLSLLHALETCVILTTILLSYIYHPYITDAAVEGQRDKNNLHRVKNKQITWAISKQLLNELACIFLLLYRL